MPRQNRVTPFGELIATPERGTLMGNRGILHDQQGVIQRRWKLKRWLICVLEFRGRKRTVMAPNTYTELFFLDEATALAAGHRPCAECRHDRFLAFCAVWKAAHSWAAERARPSADEIDDQLHRERITRDRSKLLYEAKLKDLPDGVFVQNLDWSEDTYLVLGQKLLKWTAGGYTEARRRPLNAPVSVLTPKSTVATILAGYAPEIHSNSVGSTRAPAS